MPVDDGVHDPKHWAPSPLEFASVPTTQTKTQLGMCKRYQSIRNTIVQ